MIIKYVKLRYVGIIVAAVCVVLDAWSKWVAEAHLTLGNPIAVIDGLFNWRLAYNRGVSFSMMGNVSLESLPEILAVFALVMGVFFVHWMGKHKDRLPFVLGLGFIAGGAIGNGIDRLLRDAVVDFLDFYYDKWHFPTFNVADIAISLGVICILIDAYLETMSSGNEKEKNNA